MNRLNLDAELPGKLPNLVERVELCDSSGRVVGRYFPQLDSREFQLEPQIAPDELERAQSNEQTFTTAEVLAHLEKL